MWGLNMKKKTERPWRRACAKKHGWKKIDRVWCTVLAVNAYQELGHKWVINPWDLEAGGGGLVLTFVTV